MCTVDKMLIKGIRSFSPDNTAVIEFYKPLTLIVGHNGAGKTTIIECLKMACTGELPPNVRLGQSFIHDPKVARETEVKAQIKLRFNTALQQPVVVIRSFQLTQKKTSMSFSSLDQLVQTYNRETGKKEAISYRCADMDRVVPQVMGVSKAILENVIFVHQEESSWPLSESLVLKKKFDDIFAATKYTKALDTINRIKKDKAQVVKEARLKLEHLATHKGSAHRLRLDVDKGTRRQQGLTAQIEDLEAKLRAQTEEMKGLDEQLQLWQEKKEDLSTLRTRLEMTISQNAAARVQLVAAYSEEDLDIEKEELEAWQAELEPKLAQSAAVIEQLRLDVKASEGRIMALKQVHSRGIKQEASLAAEAEAYARNLSERDQTLRSASHQAGVGQLPGDRLTDEIVDGFVDALRRHVAEQEADLANLRGSHQRQDDEASRLVDQVTAQITDASQKAKIGAQTLAENEAKIAQLQRQVEASPVSHGMVEDSEAARRDADDKLKSKQDALRNEDFGTALAKLADSLEALQRKISGLRKERDQVAVEAEEGARLQHLRRERTQKRAQIDTLYGSRKQNLSRILGRAVEDVPAARELKAALEATQRQAQKKLSEKADQLQQMRAQASSTQGNLEATEALLKQQQQEVDALQAKLDSSLAQIFSQGSSGQALDSCVASCEKQQGLEKGRLERVKALEINLKHFKGMAVRENKCEVCQRPFQGDERQQFLDRQDEQVAALPEAKAQLTTAIQSTEARLKALRALQPDWARLERLRAVETAGTRAKLENLEAKASIEAGEAGELHRQHEELQRQLQEVHQGQREVGWPIDRLVADLAGLETEIQRTENRMRIAGAARTVADVDADLESLEADRGALERQREDLVRKQSRLRDEVSHFQAVRHAAQEEAMKMRAAAEKRAAAENEAAALLAACNRLRQESADAAANVAPLKAQREGFTRDRQQARTAARQREAEREARLRELQSLQVKVQDRVRSVDAYRQAHKADRLAEVRAELESTAQGLEREEEKLKSMEEEMRNGERDALMSEQNKRQILDLLQHKRGLLEETDLRAKLEQAQAEIGSGGDVAELNDRFIALQEDCKSLRKEQNMAQGSLATIREGVMRATKELSDVNYSNIDQRYRRQLIELKTTEMVVSDLDKYMKAIEKALLTFHTTKMDDINKTIKELWQRTYRNQDIDYIEIKASGDTARATKSHNYHVVMHVAGAELEMRGRCSAGQKVLACLVIRMALAETFCLNCGILALDEPTTNLDAENARSLAESLRSIMESRAAQTNFQLVVITHDEEFAKLIGSREHAEFMWRITKDENQHSHLEQEALD